jgi:hypothetical protein
MTVRTLGFRQLFDILPDTAERHVEGVGQFHRDSNAHLDFAAFDGTHVRAVNTRLLSELLLREARAFAATSNHGSEDFLDFLHDGYGGSTAEPEDRSNGLREEKAEKAAVVSGRLLEALSRPYSYGAGSFYARPALRR